MQLQLTALSYYPDAVLDYFTPLAEQPWAILLHSGNSGHPNGRYDIMVASPEATLVTRDGITEICQGKNNREFCRHDPFMLVQQVLSAMGLRDLPNNVPLPFLGGAVGYFGYDLARSIEILPKLAQQDISLPDMAVGIYLWAVIADHHRRTVTLISYDDPTPLLKRLTVTPSHILRSFHLLHPWRANMSRTEYGEKFRHVQQCLLSGDCYQVCLSQRFSSPYNGDEWLVFRHLLDHNRAPFSAFIRLENQAVISFSPERFLHLKAGKIQTCPIKGTLPRLLDTDADLQQVAKLAASAKNQAENLMIVDLLRNDIGRVAKPGSVQVPSLFTIETFTAVHHMVSTITATLDIDCTPCDLLRACFPGGSITGAPKVRAMEIIERLEPQRRNAWCGSIGYISFCGTMDTNISIRTLLVADQYIHCSVGSGIIADSDEEEEYHETLLKAASLLPFLERFHD